MANHTGTGVLTSQAATVNGVATLYLYTPSPDMVTVPAENRRTSVMYEDRTADVLYEDRILKVAQI